MNNYVVQDIELEELLKWNLPEDITDIGKKACQTEKNDGETSILDHIFPPREWTLNIGEDEIRTYRQTVSRESSSKRGVIALTCQLNKCLQSYDTRKHGICEIRSAVFKLAFDEILRQLFVESEELGMILYRTYNELRKIKYLWKSQSVWGAESLSPPLIFDELEFQNKIEHLKKTNKDLTLKVTMAKLNHHNVLSAKMFHVQCLAVADKNHQAHKNHLRRSTRQLKERLKIMLQPVALTYQD